MYKCATQQKLKIDLQLANNKKAPVETRAGNAYVC